MNIQPNSVAFSAGVDMDGTFTFHSNKTTAKLEIHKHEETQTSDGKTVTQTYKLGISYLGLNNDQRPDWKIAINDKFLDIWYSGSKKFVFTPADNEFLFIEETDEYETCRRWVDLKNPSYPINSSLIVVHERIQSLIEKVKIFTPNDNEIVRKIFHSNHVGVFLYATNKNRDSSIYFAKDNDEFVKCNAKMLSQCRCPAGDSKWEVKISPEEEKPHTLKFSKGNGPSSHSSELSWDNIELKEIVLKQNP